MQVFKTYFSILKKQLLPIILYGVMFLSITILVTVNMDVANTDFSTRKALVMVVNEGGENSLINGFLDYLSTYASFVEPEETEEKRKDALFFRRVEYILTIPEDFSESFVTDGTVTLKKNIVPDSIEAISIDNAINNYFNMAKTYHNHIPEQDFEQLNAYIQKNLSLETSVIVESKTEEKASYSDIFFLNYFNYLGYIIIMVFITTVSMVMHSFNGIDIKRRHAASPISNRSMNIQLLFANLVFVTVYMIIFMLAGILLNKSREFNINTGLTLLNAAVFALSILCISYLVGISVKSKKAISALSTAISLSFAFLSGIFVPQELLGEAVLKVASFTPTFWYVRANNVIAGIQSSQWKEISTVLGYIGIQLGFAAALLSIALVVSKRKSQQAN